MNEDAGSSPDSESTISIHDIVLFSMTIDDFLKTLNRKLESLQNAKKPKKSREERDLTETETPPEPDADNSLEQRMLSVIKKMHNNNLVLKYLIQWFKKAKVNISKFSSKTKTQKVIGGLKSLGMYLAGIDENTNKPMFSDIKVAVDDIKAVLANTPDAKKKAFISSVATTTNEIPLESLASILNGIPNSDLKTTTAFDLLSKHPEAFEESFENTVKVVTKLIAHSNAIRTSVLFSKRREESILTAHPPPEGIPADAAALIARLAALATDDSSPIEESKGAIEFNAELLKRYKNRFTNEEYQTLLSVMQSDKAQQYWKTVRGIKEPEAPKEETRPFLNTEIQLSNKNAGKEYEALLGFFNAIKKWKPTVTESITADDLKGLGAKQEMIDYIVNYINTIGPTKQDLLRAVFNREGNKVLIAQYIKDEIVAKNPNFHSTSHKAKNKIKEIAASIKEGNEWSILWPDGINPVLRGDSSGPPTDAEKIVEISPQSKPTPGVFIKTKERMTDKVSADMFLKLVSDGDIAMTKTKEQVAKEKEDAPKDASSQLKQKAEEIHRKFALKQGAKDTEGYKLLKLSYDSLKSSQNFEKDLAAFVDFFGKYGMSDKVVKETVKDVIKVAKMSSYTHVRADNIRGAYKNLRGAEKASVDRIASAIRKGKENSRIKKLNSILRNITKSSKEAPKEEEPSNVIPFPTASARDNETPLAQTAEQLEKKLSPLVRTVMRVINGQKELRN